MRFQEVVSAPFFRCIILKREVSPLGHRRKVGDFVLCKPSALGLVAKVVLLSLHPLLTPEW
ncbi:hypothetical protein J6590_048899 [Homalodisca vitripennis]|nr:hypothetical protein J6590_048899 [Homalodisca vitripennis]